jgi:hypothetical protein
MDSDSLAFDGLWPLRHLEEAISELLTSAANEELSILLKLISPPLMPGIAA